ncbi:hypothetical protein [Acinetobacter silvestris]|uniref:Uncharacterized protein n=1 Tax=Acinetobacter silvestris TaxID=1977882 RepID=A0A1Y3CJP2_9GAMM|nr:hypothetical protein [Acinetobacter silvestris]OTG66674.1 hypothetical protein B9T28_05370 [Acinetobacter silvestris]
MKQLLITAIFTLCSISVSHAYNNTANRPNWLKEKIPTEKLLELINQIEGNSDDDVKQLDLWDNTENDQDSDHFKKKKMQVACKVKGDLVDMDNLITFQSKFYPELKQLITEKSKNDLFKMLNSPDMPTNKECLTVDIFVDDLL